MILYLIIFREDTKDLIVFSNYFRNRQDELRKILVSLKLPYLDEEMLSVEEILSDGYFLKEDVALEFTSDGKILKQNKDGTYSYQPYYKGDRVEICPDGNVKRCTIPKIWFWLHRLREQWKDIREEWQDIGEDIYKAYSELNAMVDNSIKRHLVSKRD